MASSTLSKSTYSLLWLVSMGLAALATPVWSPLCGPLAAIGAYGLFFGLMLEKSSSSWQRFRNGFLWFSLVQAFQWSWFATSDFQGQYIYFVYVILIGLWGAQFGLFCILIGKARLERITHTLALAGLWTLMEYSRLYIFTGSTFNPVGMALAATNMSLQFASVVGIYGLCFWVIWVNLLGLRAWKLAKNKAIFTWALAALLPFIYGAAQLSIFNARSQDPAMPQIKVALVQTASPPIEFLDPADRQNLFDYALRKWQGIVRDLKGLPKERMDLIVLPESSVPYGTDFFAYTHESVVAAIDALHGVEGLEALPPLEAPLAREFHYAEGDVWLVTNLYWAQTLANLYSAELVIGLEHQELVGERRVAHNSALRLLPNNGGAQRYDKQMLLPMGEYIPVNWARSIAAQYGIHDSFVSGDEIKVFEHAKVPYSISVCYEETFSNFIRQSRLKGAQLLVNITSDVWFPGTRLPLQHLEHGRLRTVENGLPLIRSCNTGVTCAVDALGRDLGCFGDENGPYEWKQGAVLLTVPLFHYRPAYYWIGEGGVLVASIGFILLACCSLARRRP